MGISVAPALRGGRLRRFVTAQLDLRRVVGGRPGRARPLGPAADHRRGPRPVRRLGRRDRARPRGRRPDRRSPPLRPRRGVLLRLPRAPHPAAAHASGLVRRDRRGRGGARARAAAPRPACRSSRPPASPWRAPAGVSDPWLLVATIGAATIVLRGVVPAVLGGRPLGGRLLGAIELLPPALLAALVATQVFATKSALVLDERAARARRRGRRPPPARAAAGGHRRRGRSPPRSPARCRSLRVGLWPESTRRRRSAPAGPPSPGERGRRRACASPRRSRARRRGEALEGLSWAAWWVDDVEACFDLRERAYRRYREAGDLRGAARLALWLSDDYLEFRGEHAVAGGWTQRAARLLAELDAGPRARLARRLRGARGARRRRHGAGAAARRRGARAGPPARGGRPRDVRGRDRGRDAGRRRRGRRGHAPARRGRRRGARRASTRTCAPPGWTCCYLIGACERVRDFARAAQWCREVEAFSRRLDIRFVTGVCRTHYGAVLCWRGEWDEAERVLVSALEQLTAARPAWRADAVVRLAELRRRQGRARRGARAVRRGRAPPARPARARGAQPRPRRGGPGARRPRAAAAPHPGQQPGRARRAGRGAGPGGGGGRRPRRRGRAARGTCARSPRRSAPRRCWARRASPRASSPPRPATTRRRAIASTTRPSSSRRPARRWRRPGPARARRGPARARAHGGRRPRGRRGARGLAMRSAPRPTPAPRSAGPARSARASSRCSASSPKGSAIAPSPSASRSASTRSTATSPTSTPSCAAPRAPPPSRSHTGSTCSRTTAVELWSPEHLAALAVTALGAILLARRCHAVRVARVLALCILAAFLAEHLTYAAPRRLDAAGQPPVPAHRRGHARRGRRAVARRRPPCSSSSSTSGPSAPRCRRSSPPTSASRSRTSCTSPTS